MAIGVSGVQAAAKGSRLQSGPVKKGAPTYAKQSVLVGQTAVSDPVVDGIDRDMETRGGLFDGNDITIHLDSPPKALRGQAPVRCVGQPFWAHLVMNGRKADTALSIVKSRAAIRHCVETDRASESPPGETHFTYSRGCRHHRTHFLHTLWVSPEAGAPLATPSDHAPGAPHLHARRAYCLRAAIDRGLDRLSR
jgi:hypothetical protein